MCENTSKSLCYTCYSLIHPNVCHGLLLAVLQKSATCIRLISKENWNQHTSPIFKEVGIRPLDQLYLYYLGNFMFLQYKCWSELRYTQITQGMLIKFMYSTEEELWLLITFLILDPSISIYC